MKPALTIPAATSILLLAACGHPQSMLSPGGPAAQRLANLGWFIFMLFSAVALIMWGLILWVSVRRRGTFDRHEPPDIGGGQGWVHIGGFAIPFVILAVVFILGLTYLSAFPLHAHHENSADIEITGHQWWWEVRYLNGPPDARFITANEIHVPVGQPIDIDLTSVDVIHSFFVPSLHGKVDLIPGQTNRIRVEASSQGVYRGQCAEFCGAQHANMALLVVAEPPAKYQAWVARQLQDAEQPVTDQQIHGRDLFLARPCATCHTIRGIAAGGRVGPDLTHFASRMGIAANAYRNNDANLSAWIVHAQALKPEVVMPNITEFKGKELQDIVAYLRQLR